MVVLVVNNYWKPKNVDKVSYIEEAVQENSNESCQVISFKELGSDFALGEDVSSVILSGSSAHFSAEEVRMYEQEIEFIRKSSLPILGICYGHQLIAYAFGSQMGSYDAHVKGFQEVEILEPNELFSGWERGSRILVRESHKDYAASLPESFELLAASPTCRIEAIKHRSRPIYGIQFHAERCTDEGGERYPDGYKVIENFFERVVKGYAKARSAQEC